MSVAWVLMLALQAGPPASAAEAAPRSAFFCQVADRSDRRGAEALRPLHVLLAGTDDAVGEREPIETFDPTGLLGGGRFTRFLRNPAAQGYALVSGETRDPQAALLSLVERDGGPELGAGLGFIRDGSEPRFLGRCLRYRSGDTAADFQSFNASMGRR
jgi:hypothetical protein